MDLDLFRRVVRSAAVLSYSRSGGPGGQNVNKVNTKVTLRLPLAGISDGAGLSEAEFCRLRTMLAGRITVEDELIIISDEERSRRVNQERAFSRLEALIAAAAQLPKRRRSTRPGKAAREQRLQSKKLQGQKKAARRPVLGE